jgi:uncharacterized protein
MLRIKTYLKEVHGKGIGLFADEYLPEGKVWWEWDHELDMIVQNNKYETLELLKKQFVKKYGVRSENGDYWLYSDNAKFINHSENPNSMGTDDQSGVSTRIKTTRPVKLGEELTVDYRKYVYDFPEGVLNFEVV